MCFMGKCEFCKKEITLPFQCQYCNSYFCTEHRLPENHGCVGLKIKKPIFRYSKSQKIPKDETQKKASTPAIPIKQIDSSKHRANIKKVAVVLAIIIPIALLGLLFIPSLIVPTPNTVYVNNIPFEDDFHLSKNILSQGGKIEYRFDITHTARKIDITIISTEAINCKLICRESGTAVIERDWTMLVSMSPLLQKGTWIVQIEPFYSNAEGIMTLNYGVMSWAEFIDFSALRENAEIKVSYRDNLNETISAYVCIKTKVQYDWVKVWSCTVDGIDRNNFTRIWTCENKDYIVYFTVNHELFGELEWSLVLAAPFSPPYTS